MDRKVRRVQGWEGANEEERAGRNKVRQKTREGREKKGQAGSRKAYLSNQSDLREHLPNFARQEAAMLHAIADIDAPTNMPG